MLLNSHFFSRCSFLWYCGRFPSAPPIDRHELSFLFLFYPHLDPSFQFGKYNFEGSGILPFGRRPGTGLFTFFFFLSVTKRSCPLPTSACRYIMALQQSSCTGPFCLFFFFWWPLWLGLFFFFFFGLLFVGGGGFSLLPPHLSFRAGRHPPLNPAAGLPVFAFSRPPKCVSAMSHLCLTPLVKMKEIRIFLISPLCFSFSPPPFDRHFPSF